jgi:hypothetical protein
MHFECPACSQGLCGGCKSIAHPGATCEEYKLAMGDSELVALAKQEGWRECTSCQVYVQLKHGCNHMTCFCGHHFCYGMSGLLSSFLYATTD